MTLCFDTTNTCVSYACASRAQCFLAYVLLCCSSVSTVAWISVEERPLDEDMARVIPSIGHSINTVAIFQIVSAAPKYCFCYQVDEVSETQVEWQPKDTQRDAHWQCTIAPLGLIEMMLERRTQLDEWGLHDTRLFLLLNKSNLILPINKQIRETVKRPWEPGPTEEGRRPGEKKRRWERAASHKSQGRAGGPGEPTSTGLFHSVAVCICLRIC